MKKILSLILSAVILFTSVSGLTLTAYADTGSCGANVSYNFNTSTGALVISGTGDMTDYETDNRPVWFGKEVKSITVQNGVTSIGNRAFQGLQSVESISIADSVKSIGENAFNGTAMGANPLMTIHISANVESIGSNAFRGMTKVAAFSVNSSNKEFSSDNGVLYNKDKTLLITSPSRLAVDTLTLPSTVTEIKAGAFYKSLTVKNIIMPASVNTVGDGVTSVFSDSNSGLTVYYSNNSAFGWSAYLKNANINSHPYPVLSFVYCGGDIVEKEYKPFTKGSEVTAPAPTKPLANGDKMHQVYSFPTDYADVTEDAVYHESVVTEPCDFSKYDIVKEPTVLENGIGRYTCTVCGYTDDVVIPKEPCDHDGDRKIVGAKEATCTETGYSGDEVCLLCNQYVHYGSEIAVKPHDFNYDKAVTNPTCTERGFTTYTCVCGKYCVDDYVNALNHSYDTVKITKSATCTATGTKMYVCGRCNATKTETIAKKTHTYKTTTKKATTKSNGSIVTKCSVCGAKKSSKTIYYPKTVTLSTTTYTYNGKVRKPTVTVKDSKGKKIASSNYTVTYAKGRKSVGKYNVTIKFKGNYSGTVTKTFTIKPKSTSISKLTAGKKKFTVKWKKQTTQTTGYQIQYSTSSKFKSAKTVTVSKNKTTSKSVSKLKAKKKYYVRVRTYKTVKVNGKHTKIYSSWSKAKAVTTKK